MHTVDTLFKNTEVLSFPENFAQLRAETVTGITHDSREVEPGNLFVAIPGYETDGHRYLPMALEKGALLAVVERRCPECPLPQVVVESSRAAQADLAAAFYDFPSRELALAGITGSNGKTSTSLMLESMILGAGETAGVLGTVAYRTGVSTVASQLTTPDSPDLQRYLREMVETGIHYAVMEASSIGQLQDRNRGCEYKAAAFINLGREHLDFHGSMENYFAAKKHLITDLPEEAVAILNRDDISYVPLLKETRAQVYSFGCHEEADIRAVDVDISTGFPKATLLFSERLREAFSFEAPSLPIALRVPGIHSLLNAMAALGLALALGFDPEPSLEAVGEYQGVERRFQEVYDGAFRIFDDHFANAGNIHLSLRTLSGMDYGALKLVYAIRGRRGVTVNRENMEELVKWWPSLRADRVIASRSRDVAGHYDEVLPEEEAVFCEVLDKAGIPYEIFDTLDEAVETGLSELEAGDLMLLAGCQGMDAGARLALTKLAQKDPARAEEILAPIKDRVCGW